MNNQPMGFNFDSNAAEAAKKAGSAAGISDSGAYVGIVTSAVYEFGQNGSKSQTLVLSLDSDGQKANFIRMNFVGREGQQTWGYGLVMAAMWAAGVRSANPQQRQGEKGPEWYLPELEGKQIGLVLQKVLTSKQDGSDSYKFEPRHVFHPQTRKTYKEHSDNVPATDADTLAAALIAQGPKDERKKGGKAQNGGGWGAPQGQNSGWGAPQNTDPDAIPYSRTQQYNDSRAQQQTGQFDDDIPF